MSNRLSPISPAPTASHDGGKVLSHPTDLQKLGVKGPNLSQWAQSHGLELPAKLYDVKPVGDRGLLARVGSQEIILECPPDDTLLGKIEQAISEPGVQVYRIEQQSATIEITAPEADRVFAQTCGINISQEPVDRIVYTRVAGASCGVIPLNNNGQRVYRIWIDCTLAPYLWETLAEIVNDT